MSGSDSTQKGGGANTDWTRREMPGIPASLEALWVKKDEAGGWRYAVELNDGHSNAQGFIHGGVLMTFMDHGLSLVAWESAGRAPCATIQLDSHFVSSLRAPAFVELDAEIVRTSKKLVFMRGRLKAEGRTVMEATGVWSVLGS